MSVKIAWANPFKFLLTWLWSEACAKITNLPSGRGEILWQQCTQYLQGVLKIWYEAAYTIQPLSVMPPVSAHHAGPLSGDEEIRSIPSLHNSGVSKESIFPDSASRVRIRICVPRRALLRASVAFLPDAWTHNSGGIECRIEVLAFGNRKVAIWRKQLFPGDILRHRRRLQITARLRRFAQQEVDVTLTTAVPSGCSTEYARAVWSDPVLLVRRPLHEITLLMKTFLGMHGWKRFFREAMNEVRARVAADAIAQGGFPVQPRDVESSHDLMVAQATNLVKSPSLRECRTFAIYTSSRGNYFFHELSSLLLFGLKQLGFNVEKRTEKDGFANDADWHVVVAPHEFFYLGKGNDFQKSLPSNLILFNTEQPSTQWFAKAYCLFPKCHSVWDMNQLSAELIRSRGFRCAYLPLGYVTDFALFDEVAQLPTHYGTSFLEPEISKRSYLATTFPRRPIDILFIGYLSPRREKFFAAAASALSKYRCYFYFWDAKVPVLQGENTYMDTRTAVGLAQRSKIVLNVHHGDDRYFEWHRIVMHGIWQRTLVISESCDVAPPFQVGRDFVAVPLAEIPNKLCFYLSSTEGRAEGQTIVEQSFRTLTENCCLTDSLRELVVQLYIPRSNSGFWQRKLNTGQSAVDFGSSRTDAPSRIDDRIVTG